MQLIFLGAVGTVTGSKYLLEASATRWAVDGDALDINGKRVILLGANGPERGQTCEMNGRPWACWQAAVRELETLVSLGPVRRRVFAVSAVAFCSRASRSVMSVRPVCAC